MTIFDKEKQKLIQFCSSFDFTPKVAAKLLDGSTLSLLTFNMYTNDQYNELAQTKFYRKVTDTNEANTMHVENDSQIHDRDEDDKHVFTKPGYGDDVLLLNQEPCLTDFLIEDNCKEYRKVELKRMEK
jgi:hypothetical protein